MMINKTIDGIEAYATSDLICEHPTKPGLYKIHGRADDQIMLSTGEKVRCIVLFSVYLSANLGYFRRTPGLWVGIHCPCRFQYSHYALPIFVIVETILCQDPLVHAAVMFGRERTSNGVIIAPKSEHAFDPTDLEKLAKFREDIW